MSQSIDGANDHELSRHVAVANNPHQDAGARARLKVAAAKAGYKAAVFTRRLILLVLLLSVMGAGGVGYYGYKERVTGRLMDQRECSTTVGDYSLTGKRTYSYRYSEYFGYRVIDTSAIEEKTIVDIRGTGMVIVGQTTDKWWASVVDTGERGIEILKPANVYTFVIDEAVNVIDYNSFCK